MILSRLKIISSFLVLIVPFQCFGYSDDPLLIDICEYSTLIYALNHEVKMDVLELERLGSTLKICPKKNIEIAEKIRAQYALKNQFIVHLSNALEMLQGPRVKSEYLNKDYLLNEIKQYEVMKREIEQYPVKTEVLQKDLASIIRDKFTDESSQKILLNIIKNDKELASQVIQLLNLKIKLLNALLVNNRVIFIDAKTNTFYSKKEDIYIEIIDACANFINCYYDTFLPFLEKSFFVEYKNSQTSSDNHALKDLRDNISNFYKKAANDSKSIHSHLFVSQIENAYSIQYLNDNAYEVQKNYEESFSQFFSKNLEPNGIAQKFLSTDAVPLRCLKANQILSERMDKVLASSD